MSVWEYPRRQRALEKHRDLLFDLQADPNETNNLAEDRPEVLKEMKAKMQAFLDNLGEVPEPKLKAIPFDDPRKK